MKKHIETRKKRYMRASKKLLLGLAVLAVGIIDVNAYQISRVEITLDNGDLVRTNISVSKWGVAEKWPDFKDREYKEIKFTGLFNTLEYINISTNVIEKNHSIFGLEKIVFGKYRNIGFELEGYLRAYIKPTMDKLASMVIKDCDSLSAIETEVNLYSLKSIEFHGITNSTFKLPESLKGVSSLVFRQCEIDDVYLEWDAFEYAILKSDIKDGVDAILDEWGYADRVINGIRDGYRGFVGALIPRVEIELRAFPKLAVKRIHMSRRLSEPLSRRQTTPYYKHVHAEYPTPVITIERPTDIMGNPVDYVNISWTRGDLYSTSDFVDWNHRLNHGFLGQRGIIMYQGFFDGDVNDRTPRPPRFYRVIQEIPYLDINRINP